MILSQAQVLPKESVNWIHNFQSCWYCYHHSHRQSMPAPPLHPKLYVWSNFHGNDEAYIIKRSKSTTTGQASERSGGIDALSSVSRGPWNGRLQHRGAPRLCRQVSAIFNVYGKGMAHRVMSPWSGTWLMNNVWLLGFRCDSRAQNNSKHPTMEVEAGRKKQ